MMQQVLRVTKRIVVGAVAIAAFPFVLPLVMLGFILYVVGKSVLEPDTETGSW